MQQFLLQNNSLVPPGFDPVEDDVPLPQDAEVMQDILSIVSSCNIVFDVVY